MEEKPQAAGTRWCFGDGYCRIRSPEPVGGSQSSRGHPLPPTTAGAKPAAPRGPHAEPAAAPRGPHGEPAAPRGGGAGMREVQSQRLEVQRQRLEAARRSHETNERLLQLLLAALGHGGSQAPPPSQAPHN
nr:uncharacterized protein LOC129383121 [Dermacentor andersoni]